MSNLLSLKLEITNYIFFNLEESNIILNNFEYNVQSKNNLISYYSELNNV